MSEILMWSHYADNHRGVCLEFEITNEETIKGQLININYDNDLTIIDNIERTSTGHLSINITSNGKFLANKFKNWSYEEELRTYIICEEANFAGKEKPFLGNLVAIYFGKNAAKDDIDLVKHNTSHINSLRYFIVDLNTENLKIEILREI
ncbi:DUF2971 domain-containing protein [Flavobacterium sp.]|uniref:DUF2971 domain-containing protein n=1 Tax=Flavobacterium sp. TaxID=239 RepID=UPI0037527FF0